MATAQQARLAMTVITAAAVRDAHRLLAATDGRSPEDARRILLNGVPQIVDHYARGTATLGADFYEEAREAAGFTGFTATTLIPDRTHQIRTNVAWATQPLFDRDLTATAASRLRQVVQPEVANAFRDTIVGNAREDSFAAGWQRTTRAGTGRTGPCKFCLMLADRGAVYKRDTVNFAAHPDCQCGAQAVFFRREWQPGYGPGNYYSGAQGESGRWVLRQTGVGPEASVTQYLASESTRTPTQRARLRDYLNRNFPDAPG